MCDTHRQWLFVLLLGFVPHPHRNSDELCSFSIKILVVTNYNYVSCILGCIVLTGLDVALMRMECTRSVHVWWSEECEETGVYPHTFPVLLLLHYLHAAEAWHLWDTFTTRTICTSVSASWVNWRSGCWEYPWKPGCLAATYVHIETIVNHTNIFH